MRLAKWWTYPRSNRIICYVAVYMYHRIISSIVQIIVPMPCNEYMIDYGETRRRKKNKCRTINAFTWKSNNMRVIPLLFVGLRPFEPTDFNRVYFFFPSSQFDLCAIVILSEVEVNTNFLVWQLQTPSDFNVADAIAIEPVNWPRDDLIVCAALGHMRNACKRPNERVQQQQQNTVLDSPPQYPQHRIWIWSRPLKTGFVSIKCWFLLSFFFCLKKEF